ncbi:MAG TPA: SUMF1/EgtB/PvdO family nonheme iron enzyme, partial [Gemmataceae bacterium]|nr:SUMF1/EgtB/PvdO family nonheme iron enzyme [Gemmataceae bacterium]
GKQYYQRLVRKTLPGGGPLPGGPITFVLIPRSKQDDPEPFYMMDEKVSVGLFTAFAAQPDARVKAGWNPDGYGADYPALGMKVDEAYRCARWLGANLPTREQWDRAAGVSDRGDREGPYQGKWDEMHPLKIAVNLPKAQPVTDADGHKDDVSVFGCRDMSGNGLEWTRSIRNDGTIPASAEEPVPPKAFVWMRGMGFEAPAPLQYAAWDNNKLPSAPSNLTTPDVGFRLVLEPQ